VPVLVLDDVSNGLTELQATSGPARGFRVDRPWALRHYIAALLPLPCWCLFFAPWVQLGGFVASGYDIAAVRRGLVETMLLMTPLAALGILVAILAALNAAGLFQECTTGPVCASVGARNSALLLAFPDRDCQAVLQGCRRGGADMEPRFLVYGRRRSRCLHRRADRPGHTRPESHSQSERSGLIVDHSCHRHPHRRRRLPSHRSPEQAQR